MQPPASAGWGNVPGQARYRIDGIPKVTGAKIFARDFHAADIPGWPGNPASVGRFPITGTSKWAQTYPHSHWMPPGNALTRLQWNVTYDEAVRELEECCRNPHAPGCQKVPIEGKK